MHILGHYPMTIKQMGEWAERNASQLDTHECATAIAWLNRTQSVTIRRDRG